jgi:polar amino acid transport system permease protein
MGYQWDFAIVLKYRTAFLNGTILTLELTFLSIVFGTILGCAVALLRRLHFAPLRGLCSAYIEIFRGLPLLVLLVWLYYCLPILFGVKFNSFTTAVIAMTINLSAFAAETIRSGIESIQRGQREAGLALGLTPSQVMLRIVLPQATKVMIPNMLGLYITMLKLSSLASVIAVYELLHSANNIISQIYRPLEVYTIIAVIYLAIVLPMSLYGRKVELKIRLS